MQSKIVVPWPSFIGGAVVVAFFIIVIFLPGDTAVGSVQSASVILSEPTGFELPVRLTISKIAVDAVIEQTGLTSEGLMDVPKGPANAAWYDLGTRPGEVGSAVIAGHSGWKNGIPAVFDNLQDLRKGDRIIVEDEKGTMITFVVRELRTYDPTADATNVFNSDDGKAHLNLVTCAGEWDTFSKSSSERLVVFTDKE